MKTLLLSLSLLPLLSTLIITSAAQPVYDTDGNDLKAGRSYYVLASINYFDFYGLTLSNITNETCPTVVSTTRETTDNGYPCIFNPAYSTNNNTIYLSKSFNIKFDISQDCAYSTIWKASRVNYPPNSNAQLIEIGGTEGNPGCDTLDTWFKIERLQSEREDNLNHDKDDRLNKFYKILMYPNDVCSNEDTKQMCGMKTSVEYSSICIMETRLLYLNHENLTASYRFKAL